MANYLPNEYEDELAMPGGSLRDMPVWNPADPYSTTGWTPARKAEERRRRDYKYAMYTYPGARKEIASAYFGRTGLGAKELEKVMAGITGEAGVRAARERASGLIRATEIGIEPQMEEARYLARPDISTIDQDKTVAGQAATGRTTEAPPMTESEAAKMAATEAMRSVPLPGTPAGLLEEEAPMAVSDLLSSVREWEKEKGRKRGIRFEGTRSW